MKTLLLLTVAAVLATGNAWACTDAPRSPGQNPDGATATLQQMQDQRTAIDQWRKDGIKYLNCKKAERAAAGETSADKVADELGKLGFATAIENFNAEVTRFLERYPGSIELLAE